MNYPERQDDRRAARQRKNYRKKSVRAYCPGLDLHNRVLDPLSDDDRAPRAWNCVLLLFA